jgi:DNA-binding GntR family transcriptional regulator
MPKPEGGGSLGARSTPDSVKDRLRSLILNRQLQPGERLVQDDLAEQLGVSRTPIREALHALAADGLVVLSRNKGASVAAFSLEDLKDLYSIRIPLEGYGAFLATQAVGREDVASLHALVEQMGRLFHAGSRWQLLVVNRQFYATFYAMAGRPRLYDLIMRHLDMAGLYRRMAFAMDDLYGNTVEEHLELLGVVEQGAAEEAERLTRANLERTVATLVASWERGHVPYWSPPGAAHAAKGGDGESAYSLRSGSGSGLNIEEET